MGWYSVIGYFWRLVLSGSKGISLGLSVRQYCEKTPWEGDYNFSVAVSIPIFCLPLPTVNRKCSTVEWTSSADVTGDLECEPLIPSSSIYPLNPLPAPRWAQTLPQWHIKLTLSGPLTHCLCCATRRMCNNNRWRVSAEGRKAIYVFDALPLLPAALQTKTAVRLRRPWSQSPAYTGRTPPWTSTPEKPSQRSLRGHWNKFYPHQQAFKFHEKKKHVYKDLKG